MHGHRQDVNRLQPTHAQVAPKQRSKDAHNDIEYVLSSFLNKMERRLEELSSHLSSQLCDIERKVNQNAERQADLEKTVNEFIFPTIQELGRIVARSVNNRNSQEEIKALSNRISEMMPHLKPHHKRNSKEMTTAHIESPFPNVCSQ